jgi:hypothetical protein
MEPVTFYKTVDGKLFDNKFDAIEHEDKLAIPKIY